MSHSANTEESKFNVDNLIILAVFCGIFGTVLGFLFVFFLIAIWNHQPDLILFESLMLVLFVVGLALTSITLKDTMADLVTLLKGK